MSNEFETVVVTNITNYDFPFVDMDELNKNYRNTRNTSEIEKEKLHGSYTPVVREYRRPNVPTLMWGGQVFAMKAGESLSTPRAIGEYFAKKIVDYYILHNTGTVFAKDLGFNLPLTEEQQALLKEPARMLNNLKLREVLMGRVITSQQAMIRSVIQPVETPEPQVNVPFEDMSHQDLMSLAKEKGMKWSKLPTTVALVEFLNNAG